MVRGVRNSSVLNLDYLTRLIPNGAYSLGLRRAVA